MWLVWLVWLVAIKMPLRGAMVDLDRATTALAEGGRLAGTVIVPEQRLAENIVTPQFSWSSSPLPLISPITGERRPPAADHPNRADPRTSDRL